MNKNKLDTMMCDYLQKRSTFEYNKDICQRLTDFMKKGSSVEIRTITMDFTQNENIILVIESPYRDYFIKSLRDTIFQVVNMARVNSNLCLDKVKKELKID